MKLNLTCTLNDVQEETDETEKNIKMAEYKKQQEAFESIFDLDQYNNAIKRGDRRFSHGAFKGAMMISLYRDEPRFHLPFQILTALMDIDSLFIKWRREY